MRSNDENRGEKTSEASQDERRHRREPNGTERNATKTKETVK